MSKVYFAQLMLGDRRQQHDGRQRYADLLDECRALDELGYDSIWFAEHHFAGYAIIPNCLTMVAAAARETKRIRLGAGVVVLPFHHQVRVAEEAAMVDCLSDGRLDLGLGRGYQPIEFHGFGQTVEESPQRFSDALQVVTDLLSNPQGDGNYDTTHFKGQGATFWPKPIQNPIPFWGASVSESSFARYGKLGWPILTFPANQPPDDFKRQIDIYRREYRAAGHDPARMRIGFTAFTYVHEDGDTANRTFVDAMTHYFGYLHTITAGAEAKQQSFYVEVPTTARLSGSPEQVRNRIKDVVETFGVTDIINMTQYAGYLTHEQVLQSIRLYAEQVMPAFQEAGAAAR